MRFIKATDYNDLSKKAAGVIAAQLILKPDSVLGLATGSSPVGLYKELIYKNTVGVVDFSQAKTVNLDEYIGLSQSHEQSYFYFMHDNLFNHINAREENINLPNGCAEDMDKECLRYDKLIDDLGGIDMQLLGIGNNGHIAFNEPSDHFTKGTNLVHLTDNTIQANARFFEGDMSKVPTMAISMGIKSIMQARKILIVISGSSKAQTLYDAFFGDITPQVPASILQLHPDVTVVADMEALSVALSKGVF
ncbi:MAG: glucosamine-6-phosphate deaminase [Oscillospiraceae bacterium]